MSENRVFGRLLEGLGRREHREPNTAAVTYLCDSRQQHHYEDLGRFVPVASYSAAWSCRSVRTYLACPASSTDRLPSRRPANVSAVASKALHSMGEIIRISDASLKAMVPPYFRWSSGLKLRISRSTNNSITVEARFGSFKIAFWRDNDVGEALDRGLILVDNIARPIRTELWRSKLRL